MKSWTRVQIPNFLPLKSLNKSYKVYGKFFQTFFTITARAEGQRNSARGFHKPSEPTKKAPQNIAHWFGV